MNDSDLRRIGKAEKALFDKICKKDDISRFIAHSDEYIQRGDAIEAVQIRIEQIGYENDAHVLSICQALRDIPAADVVSRDAFNRILAENHIMRTQLARIGKKPGDSMEDLRLAVYTVNEALNNYGVDVTKLWQTATAQKTALDAAYVRGKNDAYKQAAAKDDLYKPLWPNWED